jgi:hypothetical protein
MSHENAVENKTPQPDIYEFVLLAPVITLPLALPLAVPLAVPFFLHAIHGIGVGAIGALAGNLLFNPKSQELLKPSDDLLNKIRPVAGQTFSETHNKDEIVATPFS